MRIVWIFGTTVKGASLHRLSSTWAELSRKSQVQRGAFAFADTMTTGPTAPTGSAGCSAMQCHTGNYKDCWNMLKQRVWMCLNGLVTLHSFTVPSGKCHSPVAVVLPPQWQNDSAKPLQMVLSARSQTPPASFLQLLPYITRILLKQRPEVVSRHSNTGRLGRNRGNREQHVPTLAGIWQM